VRAARRRSADPETSLFDFLESVLTADLGRDPRSGKARPEVLRFAQKFQQYTGPVTAKAVEDTSFYRQPALLALNEVGGDPRHAGVSVEAFHAANAERRRHWPDSMVATATHDTKRSEDVRARLAVLPSWDGVRQASDAGRGAIGARAARPADTRRRARRTSTCSTNAVGSWPAGSPARSADRRD
jgi:(1->4)-alpha-D-glucan 1-alpha-D-glucosylmutase